MIKHKYPTKALYLPWQEKTRFLREQLAEPDYSSTLQHLTSPLHPSHSLGRLRISECKVLDSARRPFCLVWDNPDPMAPHYWLSHAIIFKSGDGRWFFIFCICVSASLLLCVYVHICMSGLI